jgi:ElaB/YqjD/DUF883 family membrane-anchored ribosome-binding protein
MNLANPYRPVAPTPAPVQEEDALSGTPLMPQDVHAPAAGDLMTRVAKGAHDTIDQLAERATPQLAQLERGLSQAGGALHDKAESMRATGDEWAESLRSSVRDHPLGALAAALAVGVLIARIAR